MSAIDAQRNALARVRGDAVGQRDAGVGQRTTDVGVLKGLENEYILRTLKSLGTNKTVGLCVGRALQLLDANSVFQSKPQIGKSAICKLVFDELPTSVPVGKKAISSVPGIKALNQLYYIPGTVNGKDSMKVADTTEYAGFLQSMLTVFGTTNQGPLTGIDAILAKDANCQGAAANHYLQIQDGPGLQAILVHVNRLFGRQLQHTKAVLDFFKKRMFLILQSSPTNIPRVDLHPQLLGGGIDALEQLSRDARALLVNYYKDCESLYQEGVQTVLRTKYGVSA